MMDYMRWTSSHSPLVYLFIKFILIDAQKCISISNFTLSNMYYKLLRNCCLLRWVYGKLNINNFWPDLEVAQAAEVGAQRVMGDDHPDQLQQAEAVSQPASWAENKIQFRKLPRGLSTANWIVDLKWIALSGLSGTRLLSPSLSLMWSVLKTIWKIVSAQY